VTHDRPTARGAALRLGIAAVAVIAGVLGYVGYVLFLARPGVTAGSGWTDVLYYTLQLFLLDAAALDSAGNLPWQLDLARFLAPATTALTLALTAKAVYDSTYQAVRARQLRDHTVVCGSGAPTLLLARDVEAEGRTCVVIGPTPSSAEHESSRRRHSVLHLGGDPRDAAVLREARVGRAREVVVVTGDSARNTDVAAAVRTALGDTAAPPRCFLEMSSPELAAALAAHELNSASKVHVEFFDPVGRAARRLLDRYLPSSGQGAVVLVGEGDMVDALEHDLRRRADLGTAPATWARLPIDRLATYQAPTDLVLAVVSVSGDLRAVRYGLEMLRRLREVAVEIVVATRSSTSLGATISGKDLADSRIGRAQLHLFNSTDNVYALNSLRDGVYLDMARAAHEAYVRQARARGESERDNPSTVPWEQLPDHLRRANVEQAYSVGDKLRESGLAVIPSDGATSTFVFEGAELERLARGEHARWCRAKTRAGWQHGPRDEASRTHPDLVEWDELTEQSRQKDRDAVAEIPEQLRRVGLQIVRSGR
jgi:hypothetical protein